MRQKKCLWYLLTTLLVTMFCAGVSSCSNDDDADDLGLSESKIRENLESGSGVWVVSEKGEGRTFNMIFRDGKTTGFEESSSSYWFTPYSIKGHLVYIKDKDAEEYHGDVLEGGIRITSLTSSKIEFYWANDRSEKYSGIKLEE